MLLLSERYGAARGPGACLLQSAPLAGRAHLSALAATAPSRSALAVAFTQQLTSEWPARTQFRSLAGGCELSSGYLKTVLAPGGARRHLVERGGSLVACMYQSL